MGVGEGSGVSVGKGEGVMVSMTMLGGGRVWVGSTWAGWQAARRNKKSRLRRRVTA